jgi:sugar-specific transcriptional regulator TrmB
MPRPMIEFPKTPPQGHEHSEKIELLKRLGLSISQAKVYCALAESEQSSAQAISIATEIHRANVYRIITSLQSLGLVEKKLTTGKNFFTAMPLKEGIQLLLSVKDSEYFETQAEAKKVIDRTKAVARCILQENNEYFDLIPKGEANLRAFKKSMDQATSSIDDVINWKGFEQCLTSEDAANGVANYRNALKRGVRIRYITNFPRTGKSISKVLKCIKGFKKLGSFEVRSIGIPPSCVFAVFDKKKAFICTLPIPNPLETPVLWSNNPTLTSLTQNYFDFLWCNSEEAQFSVDHSGNESISK